MEGRLKNYNCFIIVQIQTSDFCLRAQRADSRAQKKRNQMTQNSKIEARRQKPKGRSRNPEQGRRKEDYKTEGISCQYLKRKGRKQKVVDGNSRQKVDDRIQKAEHRRQAAGNRSQKVRIIMQKAERQTPGDSKQKSKVKKQRAKSDNRMQGKKVEGQSLKQKSVRRKQNTKCRRQKAESKVKK